MFKFSGKQLVYPLIVMPTRTVTLDAAQHRVSGKMAIPLVVPPPIALSVYNSKQNASATSSVSHIIGKI